jgi:signal transduction histidine kinase
MDIVVRETDRLNTIIMEFLEYARLKNAQNDNIELSPVLDETIMLLKNCKEYSGNIRITQQVDPRAVIKGDSQRIRQVFWNLLINACQAMPQGGEITVTARVSSRAKDDLDWCVIIIKDSGEGIAKEDRDRIFNPFFTTKTGGTGLGLSIVYRIIEDHQGTITVDSAPGRGTQFIIRLPIREEPVYSLPKNNTGQAQKRRN